MTVSRSGLAFGRLALVLLAVAGCGTPEVSEEIAYQHIISADADGAAIDPLTRERLDVDGDTRNFRSYVRGILTGADLVAVSRPDGGITRRLLIHVHGGLNTHDLGVEAARDKVVRMLGETEPDDKYYPVLVTWPSGGANNYWRGLTRVRQGDEHPYWGAFTAPVFLAIDLAEGLVHLPRTWYYQAAQDINHAGFTVSGTPRSPVWRAALARYDDWKSGSPHADQVVLGEYGRGVLGQAWRFVTYWTTIPFKLVTTALVLDAPARASWDMQRRGAYNLTHRASDAGPTSDPIRGPASGAVGVLIDELRCHMDEQCQDPWIDYEIVLVAHSMGAIVVNDLLRRDLAAASEGNLLPVSNIVYLSAASSVRETADVIVPYLKRQAAAAESRGTEPTRFYNLSLHPSAEADEAYLYLLGFPPRGSLLEWIDNFYSRPPTPTDRTMGKWINAMLGHHLFEEVQELVTFKAFHARGGLPETHSEIHAIPFWKRDAWDAGGSMEFER